MTMIKCEHPLETIRVVWHIEQRMSSYVVRKPRAHCTSCNTDLHEVDKQGRMAIDLVMAEVARKEKHHAFSDGSEVKV